MRNGCHKLMIILSVFFSGPLAREIGNISQNLPNLLGEKWVTREIMVSLFKITMKFLDSSKSKQAMFSCELKLEGW